MNEKLIASNMIAIARARKGDNKRSAMLRMVMPFLSKQTGDKLAKVIHDSDAARFGKIWDSVKHEIQNRLKNKHKVKATAADVHVFQRDSDDGPTVVNINGYGSEKVRVNFGGVTIWNREDPGFLEMVDANFDADKVLAQNEESAANQLAVIAAQAQENPAFEVEPTPSLKLMFDLGQIGESFEITDGQIVKVLHEVCKRLLYKEDPCPMPVESCMPTYMPFNTNANLLELYDYFCASKS